MPRTTLYAPGRSDETVRAVWGMTGELEVREGIHAPVELIVPIGWKVRCMGAWMNVEEEPVGGSLICDIKYSGDIWNTPRDERNWTSIFGAEKPKIEDGLIQNEGVLTRFSSYPEPLELRNVWKPEGETIKILFRADITEVGADTPGSGLTLSLELKMLSDY